MEDVRKMLDNAGKVLRFSARLESVLPADQHRQFILTYYLEDDSIAIFEQPKANSGIRYLVILSTILSESRYYTMASTLRMLNKSVKTRKQKSSIQKRRLYDCMK